MAGPEELIPTQAAEPALPTAEPEEPAVYGELLPAEVAPAKPPEAPTRRASHPRHRPVGEEAKWRKVPTEVPLVSHCDGPYDYVEWQGRIYLYECATRKRLPGSLTSLRDAVRTLKLVNA